MEGSRDYMTNFVQREKNVSFEKIFEVCEGRIHALFLFLSLLELVQQKFMKLIMGEGRNNFIVEWNENREEDLKLAGAEVERATEENIIDPELN
jgi:segregation and condensation protein A